MTATPVSGVIMPWLVAMTALPDEVVVVLNAVTLQPLTVDVLVVHVCVTWLVFPESVVGKHLT